MAEHLAIEGILGAIASASITSHLRRTGVSPFADSTGLQRCYSIWVRGILPLLLNLLDAVQASIASEVGVFLSQFRSLLSASETAFSAPESSRLSALSGSSTQRFITLSTCSELHSLALIFYILNGFRNGFAEPQIPDLKWDAAGVLENVEFWLGSQGLLRERILPLGERETEMYKKKNGDGKSALELKVLDELRGIRDVLNGGVAD
jgi:nuclear pore complex protein Nup188